MRKKWWLITLASLAVAVASVAAFAIAQDPGVTRVSFVQKTLAWLWPTNVPDRVITR